MYKKNIAYARQSLKKADKESSTVGQFQAINVYAKNNDVEVHLQIHDESSGKSLFRDGIQRVMQFIKNEEVNMLIVWRLDRLTRNTKDLLSLFELCESHNTKIISLNDAIAGYDSSIERFKVQLLASVAQWQREIISENKTLGLQAKFHQGHIIGTEAPFGYKYKDRAFHLMSEEAYTVKAVFNMYLNGLGYKKISQITNKMNSLIPRTPAQVKGILINPKYTGDYHSKYGVLKNKLPKIITHKIYDKALKKRESKQIRSEYKVPARLRRKVKCPYCSNTMTTFHDRKQNNSTAKYACATKIQRQYHDCPMPSIAINKLEQQVFHIVMDYLSSPTELARLGNLIHQEVSDRQNTALRQTRISKIDKAELINQFAAGHITKKQFQDQICQYKSSSATADDVLTLKDIQSKLLNLTKILDDHKNLKHHLFQLIERVEVEKSGDVSGVFLSGINGNIRNKYIKESIENELIGRK